ncbi:hypothetical protein LNP26_28285 [Klebsiella variicola subsp. variicola]|nr:hypothetical protein [Klebsiella variicola subsp. variicola]
MMRSFSKWRCVLIMHGDSLGDRFPIALHLWYLTFALLCLKVLAIAIGEAESIQEN